MKKYLFIDRDGTIILEPEDEQVDSLAKIRLCPQVIPALLALQAAGYSLVMVSNQDGLGTASFPLAAFTHTHEFILELLASQGITFEQVLICPHRPDEHCTCRKPQLGLVRSYLRCDGWDRLHSYVIGDRDSDEQLGAAMGLKALRISPSRGWEAIANLILGELHGARRCHVERVTRETAIDLSLDLDSPGQSRISTGIGFFDHMLEQIATHAAISIKLKVQGDLQVDMHHTIEDTGLVLGQGLRQALGDKRGIARFGFCLPMDEVYARVWGEQAAAADAVEVALDISGRPYANLQLNAAFTREDIGNFPTQMVPHFFRSLATAMGLTLYMQVSEGNAHHQVEALFKAFGRALRQAVAVQGTDLPSSKGMLS